MTTEDYINTNATVIRRLYHLGIVDYRSVEVCQMYLCYNQLLRESKNKAEVFEKMSNIFFKTPRAIRRTIERVIKKQKQNV